MGHAMAAGYGRYRRAPCEVGRKGPEKFEYCGTADGCTKGSKVRKFYFAKLRPSSYKLNNTCSMFEMIQK